MWPLAALALCLMQDAQQPEGSIPTFGTTVVIPSGLRGLIYFTRPGSEYLPRLESLKPVGVIYTSKLAVWPQHFMNGFPGVTDRFEWFAIDYTGRFWIEKPGEYRFSLLSDDGSILYIDDRVVINNDGVHAPLTVYGSAKLSYGIHRIRVSYMQGPATMLALALSIAPPKQKFRVFSTEEFKPPPSLADWKVDPATEFWNARDRSQPLPHAFDFHTAVYDFPNPASRQTGLAFSVPASRLKATAAPEGGHSRMNVSVLALVKSPAGEVVDRFSLDAPYQIPSDRLARVRAGFVTYTHPTRLAPGSYSIEAAILDREAGQASASIFPIEVPSARTGVAISSLMLVDHVEPAASAPGPDPFVLQDQRVVPLLETRLPPDATPRVYFVVYPDKLSADKPSIRVEFLTDGQPVASQTAELPPPLPNGAIPMLVAAPLRPGSCELRITALQGHTSASAILHYGIWRRGGDSNPR